MGWLGAQQCHEAEGKVLEILSNWGRVYTVEADIIVKKRPEKRLNIFYFRSSGFWSKFAQMRIASDHFILANLVMTSSFVATFDQKPGQSPS